VIARSRLVAAMAALLALVAISGAVAQEEPNQDPNAEPPWISADLPPSAYITGERPGPVEKVYRQRLKKVWKKMVQVLEDEKVPIVVSDRDVGLIQTELIVFHATKETFSNVATRPEIISKKRPILRKGYLNSGRYSLEILISPDDRTRVSIRAYLEERARHLGARTRIWVERYSNGNIENYFLSKLDQALE
jgi:hypothetical protein